MWQNSKIQIVTKLKTRIVTKLKNSICDKTQNNKLWQNSKTQSVTKLKKIKWWQNSITQNALVVIVTVVTVLVIVTSFRKNNLTPRQPMICSLGCFSRFAQCFKTRFHICFVTLDPHCVVSGQMVSASAPDGFWSQQNIMVIWPQLVPAVAILQIIWAQLVPRGSRCGDTLQDSQPLHYSTCLTLRLIILAFINSIVFSSILFPQTNWGKEIQSRNQE